MNGLRQLSQAQYRWLSCGLLFLLTLAFFGPGLFTSQPIVLAEKNTDLAEQFVHWREFGFAELARGNLALWNPHIFSGIPYFGGFQSALLYPPNWVYLFLPLAKAINAGMALHVLLAGVFMFLWAEYRKLHPFACLLCAVLWMFCGPHFLHIYAGHLPNLCTLIWAPLIFLAIDGMIDKPSIGWGLLGSFAIAMQILAGHPQYVFYTAFAAAIYSFLCLFKLKRYRPLAGLAVMCAAAVALTAVQLFTGLASSAETVRSVGLTYAFASVFSFPPENFFTLLAPTFFGDVKTVFYWGRCYLWEMCVFISVTGLFLAILGASSPDSSQRRFAVTMTILLFIFALGARTPLFRLLFDFVPGFDQFRGASKFTFLACMFLILLAGMGFDKLLRTERITGKWISVPMIVGILLFVAGVSLKRASPDFWNKLLVDIYNLRETYVLPAHYQDPAFYLKTLAHATKSLFIAAVTCLLAGILLWVGRTSRSWRPALGLLAAAEILIFAWSTMDRFDLAEVHPPALRQFLQEQAKGVRVRNPQSINMAMTAGSHDIWGYDPSVSLRYAQFIALTQGVDPDKADQTLALKTPTPLLALLRCRYWMTYETDGVSVQEIAPDPLPRLQLVTRYRMETERDRIFAALADDSFDPRREVILEQTPAFAPVEVENPGTATLLDESTDHLTIEADLSSPAILLITDTYSKHWKANSSTGSPPQTYDVLPANYCLRAIPLAAGKHTIRLEYLPTAFVAGKWISLAGAIAYIAVLGWWIRQRLVIDQGQKNVA